MTLMLEIRQSITTEEAIATLFPDERGIPAEYRHEEPVIQKEYLINGQLRIWNGPMQEVLSPVCVRTASGVFRKAIGSYPVLTAREAMEALDAAEHAYDSGRGLWPSMPVNGRIAHIEEFLHRMQEKKKDIIHLLMWEIGKSFDESEKEFARTIGYARNTIEALKELDRASSKFVAEQGIIGQIRRAPLGVVLCMGPFNYPLNETFTTLIPALLMGNTVILKPPKLGVLLHRPLIEAFRTSFPPGVINTVYGDGREVITPIVSSGRINILAFIGSSRVADILKSQHPQPHRLRSVLGLEAKNPAIVLPDADMDLTVTECVKGSLSFNGQRCTALKILFVHSQIAKTFLERFAAEINKLKFGMPWDEDVTITPLPEEDKTDYLAGLVEDAKRYGARIVNEHGGAVNKTFFYPALLYPVTPHMRLYHEEQFGPVVPVVLYDDIEEPIRYCIESSYGQQASIFGNDAGVIARLVDVLVNQVCRVNINSMCQRGPDLFPFAGRKDSGEGTLSVMDALRVFSIRTIVAAREIEANRAILEEIVNGKRANP
jgi:glyceraldehyde-3-phosphate dehydrogenase (NADP+)